MTLDEARRFIRDSSQSLAGHMIAASVIAESPDSSFEDLLICARHSCRSIAWLGASRLHMRTGRPQRHDESGWLIIEHDGWDAYFD